MTYFTAVATVELLVVENSRYVCSGTSVTLQCSVTGDILTWKKRDGDINLLRNIHTSSVSGPYQWQLEEIDEYKLQSSITFFVSNQFTMNCTNNEGDSSSVTLVVEGNIILISFTFILFLHLCRSTECTGSSPDGPGQDQETEQDSLLSVCGVEHS